MEREVVKISFSGTTGQLFSTVNTDIRNTQITHPSTGKYTVNFLTACAIDETETAYPIINVTCQSPTGTTTAINVLNPTVVYQAKNDYGYLYAVSFQIEIRNIVNTVTLPSSLLTLLGFTFNVATFVNRSIVMVDCEMSQRR